MQFVFEEQKSAEAAAHFIGLNEGAMHYMVLIKLLYLSDRISLEETGAPITGDRMVVLPHGPVLGNTLDLIAMGAPAWRGDDGRSWHDFIAEPDGMHLVTARQPGRVELLSRYELDVLDRVYRSFGEMSRWDLMELTHTLPEWQDPCSTTHALHPEDILRAVGKSPAEIAEIAQLAEELYWLRTSSAAAEIVRSPTPN